MFKSLGLGICCLALGFSGVARASVVQIDGGKYGEKCDVKIDHDSKCHVDFNCDIKSDLKDICADKADLKCDFKDLKADVKDLKRDEKVGASCVDIKKDLKDIKADWCDIKADKEDLKKDICDLHFDLGCDHHEHSCDPAAVPAPSAAAFGGLGIAGVMAMAGLRKRRSVIC